MEYRQLLESVCGGRDVAGADMRDAISALLSGEWTEAQTAAFITAMKIKGETPAELAAAAATMRQYAVAVKAPPQAIDMCGTGGDGAGIFNVSTTAVFVAAAAGAIVAKHGNRAVSGASGSYDLLVELGMPASAAPPEKTSEIIKQTGIGFMFAPHHHPAMKHAAAARKSMAVRTMFNLLGPMTNPAGVSRQVVGIFAADMLAQYAETLAKLGAKRAMVVHGNGLDEITIDGKSDYAEFVDGAVVRGTIAPEDAGLQRANLSDIRAQTTADSKRITLEVLEGKKGAARDITILNAAAALMVADIAKDFPEGASKAAQAIDTGKAKQKMQAFISACQNV